MFFILQKELKEFDLEIAIIQDILDQNKWLDSYILCSLKDLKNNFTIPPSLTQEYIPIGSIQFVETWLQKFHGISHINPIEVPVSLRLPEFLKRDYAIISKDQFPPAGRYFFKDVSRLKKFSGIFDISIFSDVDIWNPPSSKFNTKLCLNETHLYQISEIVDIKSEYRVYVQNHKIQAISNYDGDPCIFPDTRLIQKMIAIYSMQTDCPLAYTLDIAVGNRGTFLLEIHPFVSVGLYNTLWSRNLLYAYRSGIDYLLNHNTPPSECHIIYPTDLNTEASS